jgi:hypothetical protein
MHMSSSSLSPVLAAACLTVGLVTAFDAPAHAQIPTTSTGVQLYDGTFLTGSSFPVGIRPTLAVPVPTSPQTPPPGAGPVGFLFFTQSPAGASLVGQTFESAFGPGFTEQEIIGDLENPTTASQADLFNFEARTYPLSKYLSYNYNAVFTGNTIQIVPSNAPVQAYLFSNGTSVGTLADILSPSNSVPGGYSSGFGLVSVPAGTPGTPPSTNAVPEAGAFPLLAAGLLPVGLIVARRRRAAGDARG